MKKTTAEIIIEMAQPSDAEEIQDVFYFTWLATYPNVVPGVTEEDVHDYYKDRFKDEKIQMYRTRIRESLNSEAQKYYIAKVNTKIVGVCIAQKFETKNQLKAIYVLPNFQGMGIGNKLWDKACTFFNLKRDTTVEVAEHNIKAIEFYKRRGFVDTGRRWVDKKFTMKSGATFPEMEMLLQR